MTHVFEVTVSYTLQDGATESSVLLLRAKSYHYITHETIHKILSRIHSSTYILSRSIAFTKIQRLKEEEEYVHELNNTIIESIGE